jgi:PAS domain S-box-containing protein
MYEKPTYDELEQKLLESEKTVEALKESAQRYRRLAENSPDMIYRMSLPDGRYEYVNPASTEILGYSPAEIYNNPLLIRDIIHPEWQGFLKEQWENLLEGHLPLTYEYKIIHKHKGVRWINQRNLLIKDDQGGPFAIEGVVTDITQQKDVEESLRKLDNTWQSTFDSVHAAIWVLDAEWKILYANKTTLKIFGVEPKKIIGSRCYEVVHGTLEPISNCPVRRIEKNYQRETEELQFGERFLEIAADPIINPDGSFQGVVHIATDITERKKTEEQLQSSQERFKTLFDKAPLGYQSLDEAGCFVEVNHTWLDTLGYTKEEILGKSFGDFLHPDWTDHFKENFPRFKAIGEILGVEFEMIRKDGSSVLMSINGRIGENPDGSFRQTHCVLTDVTERKQAEEALLDSEKRFRSIVENTDAGYFFIDKNGIIQGVNKAWIKMYRYSNAEEIVGNHFAIIQKAADAEEAKEFVDGIMNGDSRYLTGEFSRKCNDDTVGYHTFSARPVTRAKEVIGIEGFIIDTTDRKQAEEEKAKLEIVHQQLHKTQSLNRMAGAIAHNFNNLLGAVIGNLELAIDDLHRDSEPAKCLAGAMHGALKAADISGQMLTYLGQPTGGKIPLDLSEICSQTLTLLQAAAPVGLMFKDDFPIPGPNITANANQIQQVLTSLFTNASEAVGDIQGVIDLHVKTVSLAGIPGKNRFPIDWQPQDKTYACIQVVDSGCGISDEDIANLFDPFFSTKFQG